MSTHLFIFFFMLIISFSFTFSSKNVPTNIEDLFSDSDCIKEPDNFVQNYLLADPTSQSFPSKKSKEENYRARVNKLIQYYSIEHSYEVLEDEVLAGNKKKFTVSLTLGDEIYYGTGENKKEAKEMAAKSAIENTSYKEPPGDLKYDKENKNSPPTVLLNNLGAKHGYQINYFMLHPILSTRLVNLKVAKEKSLLTNSSFWKEKANLDQPPKGPFYVEVEIEDGDSFFGKGHTIQAAKHNAALKAYQTLKELDMDKNSICTMKGYEEECLNAKEKLKSPISLVYEYSYNNRLSIEFNELGKTGPPHKPVFEFECVLGTSRTTAFGKSKKEAKKNAAIKMLESLPDDFQDFTDEYNKKDKRKSKNTFDGIGQGVKNFFSSSDEKKNEFNEDHDSHIDEKTKKKRKHNFKLSPKEQLFEIGKSLNLKLQSFTLADKTNIFSILSLDMEQKYICLGKGSNHKIASEYSALNALKLLHSFDLLQEIDVNELDKERFSFDNFIWLAKEEPSIMS